MNLKAIIMNDAAMQRSLKRMSHEILERNRGCDGVCLIGIHSRGVPMAKRLADNIKDIEGKEVLCGTLNISLYRDDIDNFTDIPVISETDIPFDVRDMNVVLVDDVIFTGRTVRAAMDAIITRGRPASIQLAALVDRGHRELPIKPDYVGKNVPTSREEIVSVRFEETDDTDCVELYGNN
ncbi:MAG: bifunctional pyr operon transcriptional regulator/uracil phosphoribosyltransferase PyrR [Clostridia bacterium]|nr:bifunctional pyr operon transcriptional regulator/uracil phosphoribosyltransferase PyrR [Clostridia bacterium]